ncbi:WD repeat-containing protein 6 [Entomortierella beljakovae]|nr:WD repeat-containing protein 6 [Entomortierella beljakovae]
MGEHPLRMHPVHLTTPVTALAYHNNEILLSGQGPYLKASLISTSKTLCCIHLGGDWKVHRIVLGIDSIIDTQTAVVIAGANTQQINKTLEARLLLVFGAKSLRVIRLVVTRNDEYSQLTSYFQHLWNIPHMKDWILDAQWLWNKSDMSEESPSHRSIKNEGVIAPPTSIAIGYAHNFVEVFELPQDPFTIPIHGCELLQENSLPKFRLCYSIQSEEHCTLFCGRFHNNTLEDLMFASGTVFCQALVWKVHHKNTSEAPIMKSLKGHEGILFGIRWSEDGKAICTVSDDRTIRVWNLNNATKITHTTHFGHTARVWDCQFRGQYLISISEDASCRVWRNPLLDDSNEIDDMSDCLACWEGHEGKSAWSLAVSEHGVVATGGGDGGIHLWRLDSIVSGSSDAEQHTRDVDLPDILTYFPEALANEKEFVRDFVITSMSQSIYATNTGYILIRNDEDSTWSTLYYSPLLRNYVSLESSNCGRVVVAGCLTGKLAIVSVKNEFKTLVAETIGGIKIQFIFMLDGESRDDFRIVIFRANCTIGVFQLNINTATSEATCHHICDLKLPKNNKAIHAAYYSPLYNLVLLGSRDGAIMVYNLNHVYMDSDEIIILERSVILERCHGNDSVSSILMVTQPGEGYEGKDRIDVYSTGRDGSWAKYRFLGLPGGEAIGAGPSGEDGDDRGDESDVSDDEGDAATASKEFEDQQIMDDREDSPTIVLQKVFRSKITKGWLEKIFIMDGELLLLGFFNKKLFVYNESKHFEIFSMHSGAANRRRWRFLTNNARLEHTRLMFHSGFKIRSFLRELTAGSELFQSAKLQNNFHGREVRHMKFLSGALPLVEGAPAPIIAATGGEDCRLRMFQYIPYKTMDSCTALKPLCNLKPHLGAAIRCIEWSYTEDPHSYILFTGGAIESMRAWQVTLSIPNSYQVKQVVDFSGETTAEHTPLSLGCFELAQCPHVSDNLETRIMDLSVFRLDPYPRKHFLASVYSDSAIRIWLYDEETNSFTLAIDASYHNKCILQVSHVRVGDGVLMLTAATDGQIAIWDVTKALDEFLIKYDAEMNKTVKPHSPSYGKNRQKVQREYAQRLVGPLAKVTVHMSGVNSLFISNFDQEGIIAVTGGDDNALAAIKIEASWDSSSRTIKVQSAKAIARDNYAHGSAIQAVAMINASEIVTTSQDQMLSLWHLNKEGDDISLVKVESQFVHVPDPSTMDILTSEDKTKYSVAIAGIGVQIFEVRK